MADLELKHDNVESKKEIEFDPRSIKVEGESGPESASEPVQTTDRGLFDFMGKKEDEKKFGHQEEAFATEFDQKVHVTQPEDHKEEAQEQKHKGLLHRSNSSSSSSSSEEEVEVDGKKIKKKKEKGLKEKIKEKISGDKKEDGHETHVPVEKYQEPVVVHGGHVGGDPEKQGFLDKIKDKLPGGHKKPEEVPPPPPTPAAPPAAAAEATTIEGEAKEKKGFLEKIKEKLPGYHPKTEEEKEKEKDAHHESH